MNKRDFTGTCIAISARDAFMPLEVDHDPDGYWPVGSRVLVGLCESSSGTNTEPWEA
jgi:hypothetical protein